MDPYADNILDHFRHPRNAGAMKKPTVRHREENLSCGDAVTIDLEITGETIRNVRWKGTGCAISQAAMSLLSESLEGMTTSEAQSLTKKDVLALLGVPVGTRRMKCALLGLHTLRNALRIAKGLKTESWTRIDN